MITISEETLDLSYLTSQAQIWARLPADERIKKMRSERWIGYTKANQALKALEDLFTWPTKQRMQNMLIIGPTNNGKSMIIEISSSTYTKAK